MGGVSPSDLTVSLEDVGGLDDVKKELVRLSCLINIMHGCKKLNMRVKTLSETLAVQQTLVALMRAHRRHYYCLQHDRVPLIGLMTYLEDGAESVLPCRGAR